MSSNAPLAEPQMSTFDEFMSGFEQTIDPAPLDVELDQAIENALRNCSPLESGIKSEPSEASVRAAAPARSVLPPDALLRSASCSPPEISPYSSFEQRPASSITSGASPDAKGYVECNGETVAALKGAMAGHSRLVGAYTAMKSTYLKLCKEFNFLLGKFNDNERIKIELIHENNELRKLLVEVIKEREMDRKNYKAELQAMRTR